jgi:hypothetical protein
MYTCPTLLQDPNKKTKGQNNRMDNKKAKVGAKVK